MNVSTPVDGITVQPVVPAFSTEYWIAPGPEDAARALGVAGESERSRFVFGDHVTVCPVSVKEIGTGMDFVLMLRVPIIFPDMSMTVGLTDPPATIFDSAGTGTAQEYWPVATVVIPDPSERTARRTALPVPQ